MTEISPAGEAEVGEAQHAVTQEQVDADVAALDTAFDEVVAALGTCAEHVQAGRLDGALLMGKMGELTGRLMGGAG